jgi:hypothetical protein
MNRGVANPFTEEYRLAHHWKFLINTASVGAVPRERTRRPSGDQSNYTRGHK